MMRTRVINNSSNSTGHNTVLSLLRVMRAVQPICRAEQARVPNLNHSTIMEIVTPLLAEGILQEGETAR
ncbi:MAG TPA: hypothetical protein VF666_10830 [Pyrinomonadaceae bacterium]